MLVAVLSWWCCLVDVSLVGLCVAIMLVGLCVAIMLNSTKYLASV